DPFSYAATETTWVNHSWLYDLVLFGLYQLLGGTGLAILKASVVAGLAAVLVFAGRRGHSWAGRPAWAALPLLSLTPWLRLRPTLLSFLFLALTLWVLEQQKQKNHERTSARLKGYWPIPVLFALWVNVDNWFMLGPLVVVLYFIGSLLPRSMQRTS